LNNATSKIQSVNSTLSTGTLTIGTLATGTTSYTNANPIAVNSPKEIDKDVTVNGVNLSNFIKTVSERMLILEADFQKHKEYPALKELYDQYKMMEKLLTDNNE